MAEDEKACDQASLVKFVKLIHVGRCGSTLGSCLVEAARDSLDCVDLCIVDLSPVEPRDEVAVRYRLQLFSLIDSERL